MTIANDEPAAGRPRMQRARGEGRLTTKHAHGRTRLAGLYQDGCAKIRLPRVFGDGPLEAVLINSSGGLTGGDRLDWSIAAGAETSTVVTTQASEKVYRASEGVARVTTRIEIGRDARLAWLPQETILFDRSALSRRLDISLARGGQALLVEPVVFGRLAMREQLRRAVFHDRWRIRYNGRLIHAEDQRFGPDIALQLERSAMLSGMRAMATVVWVHPDAEDHVERVRALVPGCGTGVSAWRPAGFATGKLLARFVAEDGYTLRKRLAPVLAMLNGKAGVPKVWSI
ncbi:urease accessory protein UreD [Pararhizobium mangrovi]|uniref:Urease accessory protein UreD n=1 Tax=Pararhizobium mangrovi TaxID=2590452 RepID=A0A506UC74_9HYPH|nr:urease accessory protein UreD [Pararhizobium mangrovi]TPW29367.1 urease accessory protein UreD [Pararhizobium mangrovi]